MLSRSAGELPSKIPRSSLTGWTSRISQWGALWWSKSGGSTTLCSECQSGQSQSAMNRVVWALSGWQLWVCDDCEIVSGWQWGKFREAPHLHNVSPAHHILGLWTHPPPPHTWPQLILTCGSHNPAPPPPYWTQAINTHIWKHFHGKSRLLWIKVVEGAASSHRSSLYPRIPRMST